MKISIKKGFGFGLTSGVITTLGLIFGLDAGTGSKTVVIGGVMIIAIADALSDSLGTHVSEESENLHSQREIWEATISTFIAKFFVALSFIIPFLFLSLSPAIIVCAIWGLSLIIIFSYIIAKQGKTKPVSVVFEHLLIAIAVIIITHYVGDLVNKIFI